ncbi:MAG: sugar phosphate isomerase/epimerase [Bryobacterales bacterium]|nr:sugar phosphate isomerase/epimerase [Bryobacterales bacterium]
MRSLNRRELLQAAAGLSAAAAFPSVSMADGSGMRMGLVTYMWGAEMDLPTLLNACEKSGMLGVELRTQHAHGVEPTLSKAQRAEVRKRFADSPVTLVGYGSNCEFHSPDPAIVRKNIEEAKQYVQLMVDCGGLGVKVKPNTLPKGVPEEKTIEQIGKALNEVAAYGAQYGQKIRVEVHGHLTQAPPVMKRIFDVATNKNCYICWNCNEEDLDPPGLDANFAMLKPRFGDTVHVRELNETSYPYPKLMKLFTGMNYKGWILMEARTAQPDKIAAMKTQVALFKKLIAS